MASFIGAMASTTIKRFTVYGYTTFRSPCVEKHIANLAICWDLPAAPESQGKGARRDGNIPFQAKAQSAGKFFVTPQRLHAEHSTFTTP